MEQKILVVDDEQRMRKLVKDFLVRENFTVLEAADGEEAVDVFLAEKDIDLIILDVMMPKDGWLAGVSRDTAVFESSDHHADGQGGMKTMNFEGSNLE